MKFEIGEVAIVDCPGSTIHGEEVTVVSGLIEGHLYDVDGSYLGFLPVYDVEHAGRRRNKFGHLLGFEPHELRKKPKPEQPCDEEFREWFDTTFNPVIVEDA